MNLFVYLLLVPVGVYLAASKLGARYGAEYKPILLMVACVLFGVSVLFPSPLIHGEQTEFLTHFFGGGVFMGLIWLYFKPLFRSNTWYQDLVWLYALTCSFGVLNELYELFIHEIHLNSKPLTDTSWDLLANTLGVLTFYVGYRAILWAKTLFFSR